MTACIRQFASKILRNDRHAATTSPARLSLLAGLLSVGLFGFGTVTTSARPGCTQAAAAGPGPQSAIADFDGDLRLDSAVIQAGAIASGSTHYSIELHLSDAGGRSLQLLAPSGGLVIEARDVNGDHTVDLVLSTAWSRHPVAVFLNDGHGSFSRGETGFTSDLFSNSATRLSPIKQGPAEAVGVPPQSDDSLCATESRETFQASATRFVGRAAERNPSNASLLSTPGRSPPLILS